MRGGGEQETVRRRRLFIPKRKPVEISHVRKLTVAKDSQYAERDVDDGGGGWKRYRGGGGMRHNNNDNNNNIIIYGIGEQQRQKKKK